MLRSTELRMTRAMTVLAGLGALLLLVTLAGLMLRRRLRLWSTFTLYLPVQAGFTLAFLLNPDRLV